MQELQSAVYRLYGSTVALQGADGPSSTQGLGEEEKGGALLESLLDETSALAHVALDGCRRGVLGGGGRQSKRAGASGALTTHRATACATIWLILSMRLSLIHI